MTHVYVLTLQHWGCGEGDDSLERSCGTFSTAEAAVAHYADLKGRKAKRSWHEYDRPLVRWDDTPEAKRASVDDYYFLARVEIDKAEDPY